MSARSDLLVNATELARQPGARRQLHARVPRPELDIDDPRLGGDVTIDVVLESTLDDIVVTGILEVDWSDECRRCLRPITDRLRVDVEERYAETRTETDQGHDERSLGPDDLDVFPIANGQIDLRPMVRENLLLAVPDAPLCREDCPGLCPTCGADLAAGPCGCDTAVRDERWAVLDQLREQ